MKGDNMKHVFSLNRTLLFVVAYALSNISSAMDTAYDCAAQPKFIAKTGMQQPVAIDTQQSLFPGLVVKELRPPQRTFRHPTWEMSGYLASTVRDAKGNIYAVPTPSIGLDKNPLSRRNYVYKVDTTSGEMAVFAKLPASETESQSNPFGTLGLTLDCDTNSLFVSSVADSTPTERNGAIYRVDAGSGKIISKLPNVDAIGLAIFDHGSGKRLYYGDARSSSVYSVALSEQGDFIQDEKPLHEFSLLNLKNGNSTQVRKLRFMRDREFGFVLVASETEFAFRLTARTVRPFKHYKFAWNPKERKWVHVGFRQ
jgi:hypothetical protein